MARPEALSHDWSRPTAYERWYASSLGEAYLASVQCILTPWLAEAAPASALDIGCGPGLVAERLFPARTRVTGVDCSSEMAHRARVHAGRLGLALRAVCGSVEALPFPSESFPLALCVNCLEFVDDRDLAFREIARVLAPSGVAIVGVLNRRSPWELTRRLRRYFTRRSYYRGRFFTEEELRSRLRAGGFEVEEVRSAVHFPPVSSPILRPLYPRLEALGRRLLPARGAVLLCRAVKGPGRRR